MKRMTKQQKTQQVDTFRSLFDKYVEAYRANGIRVYSSETEEALQRVLEAEREAQASSESSLALGEITGSQSGKLI